MTRCGRSFTPADERLLTLFAQQAAVAIINARLTAQLLNDSLTSIHTRGCFFTLATQAVHAAAADGQPLGAAILDVAAISRFS